MKEKRMRNWSLYSSQIARWFVPLLLLASLLAAAPVDAVAQKDYDQLTYPPLRDLELPPVERFELSNGLVVYLVEDHTLPKVEGYARVYTGARFEPGDKVGLASIVGQVMRTGGTTTRKGEEIDRLLENVGASVETSIGTNTATASMFTLKEHLPQVLEILADLLRNPAFPKDKIELAKVQERTAIARRNDDVGAIASREFSKLIYGVDHPFARHAEYDTIANISPQDLVAFHRRYFHPNHTILGLWGDFETAKVKKLVESTFGSWARGEAERPPVPEVERDWDRSVNFIQKDDVNQTNLRIGHLGGRYDGPDYYALDVMAEILGGGLSSRLFRHVRSDLGLAYSVGAQWDPAYDYPGMFLVTCGTKSESTVQATQEILGEIRRLTEKPVTEQELRTAKEGILNSFVFNFDTTGEIVRRLVTYEYYGYPRDFLETFKANVEKVTAEDVLRVAQSHLKPGKLILLAVGRQQDFDQPLSTLGEVNTIDIAIPSPKPESAALPEATPESITRGREVLDRAIEGMGGLEALQGIRNKAVLRQTTQRTPQGEMEVTSKTTVVMPDKMRQDVVFGFGEISLVYDGERAWQETPRGVQDLPAERITELRQVMARSIERVLLDAHAEKRQVQFLEAANVQGQETDVIGVADPEGEVVKLYVARDTGRILKKANPARSPFHGPVEEETLYSDFRKIGSLRVPFKVVTLHNQEKAREATIQSYEVNIDLDPDLFNYPAGEAEKEK